MIRIGFSIGYTEHRAIAIIQHKWSDIAIYHHQSRKSQINPGLIFSENAIALTNRMDIIRSAQRSILGSKYGATDQCRILNKSVKSESISSDVIEMMCLHI